MGNHLIDRALKELDDWPLQGEIQRFRSLKAKVAVLLEDVRTWRKELAISTQDLQDSVDRLSQSDAYVRIQHVLDEEPDYTLWLAAYDLRSVMYKVTK